MVTHTYKSQPLHVFQKKTTSRLQEHSIRDNKLSRPFLLGGARRASSAPGRGGGGIGGCCLGAAMKEAGIGGAPIAKGLPAAATWFGNIWTVWPGGLIPPGLVFGLGEVPTGRGGGGRYMLSAASMRKPQGALLIQNGIPNQCCLRLAPCRVALKASKTSAGTCNKNRKIQSLPHSHTTTTTTTVLYELCTPLRTQ